MKKQVMTKPQLFYHGAYEVPVKAVKDLPNGMIQEKLDLLFERAKQRVNEDHLRVAVPADMGFNKISISINVTLE